jgi:hypothetical protein
VCIAARETAANLGEKLIASITTMFGDEQPVTLSCVVTDNGSNFAAMRRGVPTQDARVVRVYNMACLAHTIQRAVVCAIEVHAPRLSRGSDANLTRAQATVLVRDLLAQINCLITGIRASTSTVRDLEEACREAGIRQRRLAFYSPTRWGSYYDMLHCFIVLRQPLQRLREQYALQYPSATGRSRRRAAVAMRQRVHDLIASGQLGAAVDRRPALLRFWPTDDEFGMIGELLKLLEPVRQLTVYVEGDDAFIGAAIVKLHNIKLRLRADDEDDKAFALRPSMSELDFATYVKRTGRPFPTARTFANNGCIRLRTSLLRELDARLSTVPVVMQLATVLDVRYKGMTDVLFGRGSRERLREALADHIEQPLGRPSGVKDAPTGDVFDAESMLSTPVASPLTPLDHSDPVATATPDVEVQQVRQYMRAAAGAQRRTAAMGAVDRYLEAYPLPFADASNVDEKEQARRIAALDPLVWWRDNAVFHSQLAVVARIYLAVPATSAASERVFSRIGRTITPARNRLAAATVRRLSMTAELARDHLPPVTPRAPRRLIGSYAATGTASANAAEVEGATVDDDADDIEEEDVLRFVGAEEFETALVGQDETEWGSGEVVEDADGDGSPGAESV